MSSIKKRLTIGAMSAALGLSLVAGGSWAAFNDIEEVTASVAAGELNLTLADVAGSKEFKVSNLKPGDKMARTIRLINDGSLAMKDVLLSIDGINFTNYVPTAGQPGFGDTDTYGTNTDIQYLSQFTVKVMSVGDQGGDGQYPLDIILQDITLADLYLGTTLNPPAGSEALVAAAKAKLGNTAYVKAGYFDGNQVTVTPRISEYSSTNVAKQYAGIPVGIAHNLKIEIEFTNDGTRDARGVESQNIFQGDKVDVTFTLEGRQWDGQEVTSSDMNGSDVKTNRQVNNGDSIDQIVDLTSGADLYTWSGDVSGNTLQYNINFKSGVTLEDFSSAEVFFYDASGNFLGKNTAKIDGISFDYPNSAGLSGTVKGEITTTVDSSNPYWVRGVYSSSVSPAKAVFKLVKDGVEYFIEAN
jgi:spore coat-associated protein N